MRKGGGIARSSSDARAAVAVFVGPQDLRVELKTQEISTNTAAWVSEKLRTTQQPTKAIACVHPSGLSFLPPLLLLQLLKRGTSAGWRLVSQARFEQTFRASALHGKAAGWANKNYMLRSRTLISLGRPQDSIKRQQRGEGRGGERREEKRRRDREEARKKS